MPPIAEVLPPVTEAWAQIVVQLGVASVLGWYLYHTTTKTFPNLTDRYADRIDAIGKAHLTATETITNAHDKTITAITDRFSADLAAERQARAEALQILTKTFVCPAIRPPANDQNKG